MDTLKENFLEALREAIARAGSQTILAKTAGMTQSRISDYLYIKFVINKACGVKSLPECAVAD